MTVPATIAAGSALRGLSCTHPATSTGSSTSLSSPSLAATSEPITITLTEPTGRVVASWTIPPGESLYWHDLNPPARTVDLSVTTTGPVAPATGAVDVTTPTSGGG